MEEIVLYITSNGIEWYKNALSHSHRYRHTNTLLCTFQMHNEIYGNTRMKKMFFTLNFHSSNFTSVSLL